MSSGDQDLTNNFHSADLKDETRRAVRQQVQIRTTPSQAPLIGAAVLFGLVALAGVVTAYAAVKDFAFARASGDWPQMSGVILSAPKNETGALRYAYHVDGVSYEGRRTAFLTRGYIGKPPPNTPGAKVTVYVNPIDSGTSVLVPGGSGRRFAFWLSMSGVAVFVGVAGLTRTMMAIDFPEYDVRAGRERAYNDSPDS